MVDTRVLEALAVRREGSSPFPSTNLLPLSGNSAGMPILGIEERTGVRTLVRRRLTVRDGSTGDTSSFRSASVT